MANIKSINGNPIKVDSSGLDDGAVTTAKIADGAVTSAKLAEGAIAATSIADGSISTAKLADGAVTDAKLATTGIFGELDELKVSYDGIEYDTPADAVHAQVGNLAQLVKDNTGQSTVPMMQGCYITCNLAVGAVVDIDNPVEYETAQCAVVEAQQGDVFFLTVIGGNLPRAFAVLNSDKELIRNVGKNTTYNDFQLNITDEDAAYVVFNDMGRSGHVYAGASDLATRSDGVSYSDSGTAVRDQFDMMERGVSDITGQQLIKMIPQHYIRTNYTAGGSDVVNLTPAPILDSSIGQCAVVEVQAGDVIDVCAYGTSSPRGFAILDADKHVIARSNSNAWAINHKRVITEQDAAYVVINDFCSDNDGNVVGDGKLHNSYVGYSSTRNLDDRVTYLENNSGSGGGEYVVPDYWESHIADRIETINELVNAGKTQNVENAGINDVEAFVFLTDVHWSNNAKKSPALINRIIRQTSIKTIICGGDLIEGHAATKEAAAEEAKGFIAAMSGIPCSEFFTVFGNHDDNSNGNADVTTQFTKREQHDVLYSTFEDQSNVHWAWDDYRTDAYNKYRNNNPYDYTADYNLRGDYYVDHSKRRVRFLCLDWNNPVSTIRSAWVTEVLARDDNYRVIVVYHGIYSIDNGVPKPDHTAWMPVFGPYKDKIACIVNGHVHMDMSVYYYEDGETPAIMTTCDKLKEDLHVAGTTTEQAFDVYVVNFSTGKINTVRVGEGSDREFDFSVSV